MTPASPAPRRPLALLTGAAGGMGAATSALLVARGWRVIGVDCAAARLDALADALSRAHPSELAPFIPVAGDLSDPGLIDRLQPHVDDTLAGIVNLAGVSVGAPFDRLTDDDWDTSFAVNVDAPMRICRAFAPAMAERGRGSIVNVSSPVGLIGAKKASYAASKAALHGLTMALARALGPRGVRCNLLLPGTTITHMTEDWDESTRARIAGSLWLRRLCTGEEVGKVISFLLSDDASYMTGAVVDMTAGGLYGH